ncbi:MAG: hypothetical protein AUK48_08370 [Oscillatoriales cyanobacterium CG2_30_44_21]|nr:MAG: hypothetical protein AUK48_08370 [Oscillatoriales cyanobacterium CG2_30_44_21]
MFNHLETIKLCNLVNETFATLDQNDTAPCADFKAPKGFASVAKRHLQILWGYLKGVCSAIKKVVA